MSSSFWWPFLRSSSVRLRASNSAWALSISSFILQRSLSLTAEISEARIVSSPMVPSLLEPKQSGTRFKTVSFTSNVFCRLPFFSLHCGVPLRGKKAALISQHTAWYSCTSQDLISNEKGYLVFSCHVFQHIYLWMVSGYRRTLWKEKTNTNWKQMRCGLQAVDLSRKDKYIWLNNFRKKC